MPIMPRTMGTQSTTENIQSTKSSVRTWDKLGIFVSSLCIVHCLMLPVIMVMFPSLALVFGVDEELAHKILLAFLTPAAIFAVYTGFKIHKQKRPLAFMVAGFALVVFGTFHGFHLISHSMEAPFVLVGSLLMVRAHLLNSKHCKRCEEEEKCIWGHEH